MEAKKLIAIAAIAIGEVLTAFAQSWTQTASPSFTWFSVASSADGSKLAGASYMDGPHPGGSIYLSTNFGVGWNHTSAPSNAWVSIASSADGTKLAAVSRPGPIFTSTNSGLTWISNGAPNINWYFIASSADGATLLATADERPLLPTAIGAVYTSTNSGLTWVSNSLPVSVPYWFATAISADGARMVVSSQYGHICLSTNSGATWQASASVPKLVWESLASSADGRKLVVVSQLQAPVSGGSIFTSSDGGATWISNNAPNLRWYGVASSADGNTLLASGYSSSTGYCLYFSTNAGEVWNQGAAGLPFGTISMSADGCRSAGVFGGGISGSSGQIYTSYSTPSPVLHLSAPPNLNLSWTIPSTNFVLQQSSDLANWSTVTNPPALNLVNLQNQVAPPLSASNAFFRLMNP